MSIVSTTILYLVQGQLNARYVVYRLTDDLAMSATEVDRTEYSDTCHMLTVLNDSTTRSACHNITEAMWLA